MNKNNEFVQALLEFCHRVIEIEERTTENKATGIVQSISRDKSRNYNEVIFINVLEDKTFKIYSYCITLNSKCVYPTLQNMFMPLELIAPGSNLTLDLMSDYNYENLLGSKVEFEIGEYEGKPNVRKFIRSLK